jgi:hypothetical protein
MMMIEKLLDDPAAPSAFSTLKKVREADKPTAKRKREKRNRQAR